MWNALSNYEQVMLWWEYNADADEDITFEEFDTMMREVDP